MRSFINIIKGNYLQYVRSYSFLITVAISVYVALSLVPSPKATYSTIRLGAFTGDYNSVWIGLVIAVMASTFLSLAGFFLINGSIQKDIETRIGHIIGTTQISNSSYLFSKLISNLCILITILGVVLLAGIVLLFVFGSQYTLQLLDFVLPLLLITVPTLFVVSALSLALEVLFPKKRFVQYGIFLIIYFVSLFGFSTEKNATFDMFGIQEPIAIVTEQIQQQHPSESTKLIIGFVSGGRDFDKVITVERISFSQNYVWNRLLWIIIAMLATFLVSVVFHRFNIKEKLVLSSKKVSLQTQNSAGFQLSNLAITPEFSSHVSPLIGAEIVMLVRKSPKWLIGISFCLMFAMIFVPLKFAHYYILPLVWFLQVGVWSDLVTKDISFRTYYFTASSYKPLQRLFVSRILAGVCIALLIAMPLLVRYLVELDFHTIVNIVLGAIFIILLSVFFGTLTKSKKLFEIVFFFLIYSNINLVTLTDYFGALHNSVSYTLMMILLSVVLFCMSYSLKKIRYGN